MKHQAMNPRRAAAHLAIQAAIDHEPAITHIIVDYETDDDGGWTCVLMPLDNCQGIAYGGDPQATHGGTT